MNKAQNLITKIKQLFEEMQPEPAPAPAAATVAKLSDGTEISFDKLEVGGIVTIGGVPLSAGDYTLEDGTALTVGDGGVITAVTPVAAPAPEPTPEPAPEPAPVDMQTPEQIRTAYEKFAVGTPEERLTNIETMCKAFMEYAFGWQLREAQEKANRDAALAVYKTAMEAAEQKVAAVEQKLSQQTELAKQMFELVNEIAGEDSAADPLPAERKKFSFLNNDKKTGKVERIERFRAAMQRMKESEN